MFNLPFKSYAFNKAQLLPFYKWVNHTETSCSLLPLVVHTAWSLQDGKCSAAKSHLLGCASVQLHVPACSGKLVACTFPLASLLKHKSCNTAASMTVMSENKVLVEKSSAIS